MFEALIAAGIVALLSIAGVFLFGRSGKLTGTHRYILPVAVGVLLGVVFLELIPETIELSREKGPIIILVGFLAFYLLSHFLRTYHSHEHAGVKRSARLLLVGDAVHNIADGVVIASAFAINPAVGIATTVGVALHELPQEIAEFGVLISAGYSRLRAALYNLLSASSIILGVLLAFVIVDIHESGLFILTGLAAGNLLFIAASDLIPELRESHKDHFWQVFLSTIIGAVFIGLILSATHHEEAHPEERHMDEAVPVASH